MSSGTPLLASKEQQEYERAMAEWQIQTEAYHRQYGGSSVNSRAVRIPVSSFSPCRPSLAMVQQVTGHHGTNKQDACRG